MITAKLPYMPIQRKLPVPASCSLLLQLQKLNLGLSHHIKHVWSKTGANKFIDQCRVFYRLSRNSKQT
jgi:hypothetical protein